MTRRALLPLFLAMATVMGGCNESQHEQTPTTSPTIGSTPVRALGPAVMLRHEVLAVAVRDSIVRGDLESARRNAVELGAITVGGTPELVERANAMHEATVRSQAHATSTRLRARPERSFARVPTAMPG